jgi:hypothetical protein
MYSMMPVRNFNETRANYVIESSCIELPVAVRLTAAHTGPLRLRKAIPCVDIMIVIMMVILLVIAIVVVVVFVVFVARGDCTLEGGCGDCGDSGDGSDRQMLKVIKKIAVISKF